MFHLDCVSIMIKHQLSLLDSQPSVTATSIGKLDRQLACLFDFQSLAGYSVLAELDRLFSK